jgi:hypothetical protein
MPLKFLKVFIALLGEKTDDKPMLRRALESLILGPAMALAVLPETPTQGPFKNPFEWPTYWMVEALASQPSATHSGTDSKGFARLRSAEPDLNDPRTKRFMGRLGPLNPQQTITPLAPQTMPAALVPNSEEGKGYRHWVKTEIMAQAPYLAKLKGGQLRPGECRVTYHASNESEILQPFDKITLSKGQEDGLNIGDRYDLYEVGPGGYAFSSTREIGREIIPNGAAEIVSVKSKTATARLIRCYGKISRGTRASPQVKEESRFSVMAYQAITGDRPQARVVWIPGSGQLPQPFNYAILDRGVESGFRLGDHVMLLNQRAGKMTEMVLGEGLIVHVESHSATILVHDVFPGVINAGDYALAVQTPQQ